MTDDQVLKTKAIFFGILALLTGLLSLQLPWAPRIDFDVTGFLFVLSNLGRLTAVVMFFVCAGAALTFWMRAHTD